MAVSVSATLVPKAYTMANVSTPPAGIVSPFTPQPRSAEIPFIPPPASPFGSAVTMP